MQSVQNDTSNAALKNVSQARQWYADHGYGLLEDTELSASLKAYTGAIEKTYEIMSAAGIVPRCARCAGEKPGGCCFQGVEGWYDPILLLVNLLLGVDIPVTPVVPGGCLFVGGGGCRLRGRYSFCVNYLCPAIRESLSADELEGLLKTAGEELCRGLEVEERLVRWLEAREIMWDKVRDRVIMGTGTEEG
jgi:hypothetical protein